MKNLAQAHLSAPNHVVAPPHIFKKGDIVWAKVKGYSWWPAQVTNKFKSHPNFRLTMCLMKKARALTLMKRVS